MTTYAVEVVYRGVFQKTLSRNICRGIVLAARKEGKLGTAFGRYGDSPERNGIPAKYFAVVADDRNELEESLAKYEPKEVDASIVVDDTLCKGIESWGWYGLQAINALTKPGGTLIVTSKQTPESLLEDIHRKEVPYNLAIVTAPASLSGMWVYKDDHTDVRLLGALARVLPGLVGLDSYCQAIDDQWHSEAKVRSAQREFEQLHVRPIEPAEGSDAPLRAYAKPGWTAMKEAIVVPAIASGSGFRGGNAGYQAGRSDVFKKFSTRTMRPVTNFAKCTKCTLCWMQCPDSAFNVTPEGLYEVDLEACCGCGVCEDVCPVSGCITMVNEAHFSDNASQYDWFKRDAAGYGKWAAEMAAAAAGEGRSHGLHHWGQYKEEIAAAARTEGANGD